MTDPKFQKEYAALEEEFRRQAEADDDVYLPNPRPKGPVDVVLVGMEPSLKWAKSDSQARQYIKDGYRNFLYSIEDFIVHFSVRRHFKTYHLTDISKGAIPTARANEGRKERYERWLPLLVKELRIVAGPQTPVIAIGQNVARTILEAGIWPLSGMLIHYSGTASSHHLAFAKAHQAEFQRFIQTNLVTRQDLICTAREVLVAETDGVLLAPARSTLERLESPDNDLGQARMTLLFSYYQLLRQVRSQNAPTKVAPQSLISGI